MTQQVRAILIIGNKTDNVLSTVDVTFGQLRYTVREDIGSHTPVIRLSQPSPIILQLPVVLIDVNTTGTLYNVCTYYYMIPVS